MFAAMGFFLGTQEGLLNSRGKPPSVFEPLKFFWEREQMELLKNTDKGSKLFMFFRTRQHGHYFEPITGLLNKSGRTNHKELN